MCLTHSDGEHDFTGCSQLSNSGGQTMKLIMKLTTNSNLNVLSIANGGQTVALSIEREQRVDKKFATCKIDLTSHLIVT